MPGKSKTLQRLLKILHHASPSNLLLFIILLDIPGTYSYTLKTRSIHNAKWITDGTNSKVGDDLIVYCRQGEVKALSKLWKRVILKFNFTGGETYELFEEQTAEQVNRMYEEHRKSWFHFWPVQTTEVSLSPFNSTCIGVATEDKYGADIEVKAVYSPYLVATISSIILFYGAKRLSKNMAFYYGTGVSIGMLASILIVFFIVSRLIPGKKAGIVVMGAGLSTFLTAVQYIWRTQVLVFLVEYYELVLGYLVFSGLLSFALLYWYGPPTNPRSLDIVQWTIQLIAMSMLYYSVQVRELAVASMFLLLCIYNFPISIFQRLGFYWNLRFPRKRKLLTTSEYEQQADEYTKKSLEELREFCKSPKCDAWKTISTLETPTRFADFVEGSFHLQNDELLRYDAGNMGSDTPMTSDDDSDDEIDFRLSMR